MRRRRRQAQRLAGRGRPGHAVPARRRGRRQHARDRRRSPTGCTAATPSIACAKRSCWASAACARCARSACDPQVFHTNEGHAGFLSLERIRELVESGLTFAEAIEVVRAGGVFTTHTPVPAGIDRFPRDLMEKYFTTFAASLGIDARRADGRRPATRRARRRPLQHGRDGAASRRPQQRRRPAARRGQPRDVPGAVARRHRSRRCRSAPSPTACTRTPGSATASTDLLSSSVGPRVGRRRRGLVGRRRASCRRPRCGPPAPGAAPSWSSFVRSQPRRGVARSRMR